MPQSFWAKVMIMAIYLKNRLFNEVINNDIPFERWFRWFLDNKKLNILKSFDYII